MKRLLVLAPLLLAAYCQTPPQPPGPSPSSGGSSGTGGAAPTSPCERACAKLAELGCDTAKPTPGGATCSDVCNNLNASGTMRLDTDCVVSATSCAQADRCTR